MHLTESLAFDHEDRERIYEYVERRGDATLDDLVDALRLDPRGVRHHVAILKRDGYLADADGRLRVAYEEGEPEEHHSDGVHVTIRQARQDDLSGLVGAIRQVARGKTYIEAETVADVIDHQEVLLRHNALESRLFFVATVNDEVVGWVHLDVPEVEKLRHTAELTVGVVEGYRGHGVGSHLLRRALSWARDNGFEKLYNSVPATNEDAIAFLEGHGWTVEAVRENHYKLDGEYVDEVMMAIAL